MTGRQAQVVQAWGAAPAKSSNMACACSWDCESSCASGIERSLQSVRVRFASAIPNESSNRLGRFGTSSALNPRFRPLRMLESKEDADDSSGCANRSWPRSFRASGCSHVLAGRFRDRNGRWSTPSAEGAAAAIAAICC